MKKIVQGIAKVCRIVLLQIYPDCCPFCGSVRIGDDGICGSCRGKLVQTGEPMCKRCGKPVADPDAEYCRDCGAVKDDVFLSGRSLWLHRPPVSDAVYRLKYQDCRCYAGIFAGEMSRRFGAWIKRQEIDVLVPVPIHEKRRKARGYNQAELLAQELSRRTGLPVDTELVVRVRHTDAQKLISGKKRKGNLRGAFFPGPSRKAYANALIVDDIYTTGSTVREVAKCLKKRGVKKVFFLTISIGQGY